MKFTSNFRYIIALLKISHKSERLIAYTTRKCFLGGRPLHRKKVIFAIMVTLVTAAFYATPVAAQTRGHHIYINLAEYRLYHYVGDELQEVYSISIGGVRTPTPTTTSTRRFEIYTKSVNPAWRSPTTGIVMPHGPTNPLGTRWVGLMTIERVTLTEQDTWDSLARRYKTTAATIRRVNGLPANARITPGMTVDIHRSQGYGIHGTTAPSSIGTAVSLGCMRMHNADVERLYDNLPNGVRIPVEIRYEPIVGHLDPLTDEPYLMVYYDVYGRFPDWAAHLEYSAQKFGFTAPPWFPFITGSPFSGGIIVSEHPAVMNNGTLLTVGARIVGEEYYLPRVTAELMLGENLPDNRVVPALAGENGLEYVSTGVVEAVTGRRLYYDRMLNVLHFSVTRLTYRGEFMGYNTLFVHPELGPMLQQQELARLIGPERAAQSTGTRLGDHLYLQMSDLLKIGLVAKWNSFSGELALTDFSNP
jgi:lipoprotein-anchoring transpeptidase ErfK/SrfK